MTDRRIVSEVCLKMNMCGIGVFVKGYSELYPHVRQETVAHNAQELYTVFVETGEVEDPALMEWMKSVLGTSGDS